MKIIILIENDLSCDPNLVNEFGFSVFIQDEDTSLIFDTGQSGIFIKNIEKLNDVPNLYSIRNISGLNPRTLFCYALDDDIYILLNSFLEKSSSDYKKGIEKAKNIINELGL